MATVLQDTDIIGGSFDVTNGDEAIILADVTIFNASTDAVHLLTGTDETSATNLGTIISGGGDGGW